MKKCYANVKLIDGRNFSGERKNVVVEDGIITAFSDDLPGECEIIDCENRYLSPAWIDVHGHSDLSVFELPDGGTRRAGGFGIEIAGNCGLSPFPLTDLNRANLAKIYESYKMPLDWQSYAEYCLKLQPKRRGFEVFSFCGHNTLHSAALGYEEKIPSADELKKMSLLLEETLEQGALGMSLGLLYSPGRFAAQNELDILFKCCAEHEKIVCAHLRSEGDFLLESIKEMFELCRRNGLHDFHISHLKTAKAANFYKIDALFELLDRSEKDYGVNVTFDRYPFTQSMTQLSVVGPEKYLSVPDRIIMEHLKNPAEKADFLKYLADLPAEKWDKTVLAKCRIGKFRNFCGMTFAEIGASLGVSPAEIALEMIAEDSVGTCAAFDTLSEENMLRIICDSRCFCGSDETAAKIDGQWLMPRNQFSGFRTIELQMQKGIPLHEIIAKLTWRAVERFKLPLVKELCIGSPADFTLFI
ncbi:MAG: hypothetical protein IKB71_08675 [Lentisphaeria bacterium]|nr:hypothetical protein [Lentisphaeria bacterium]